MESPVKVPGWKDKREKNLQPSWNETVAQDEMIPFPLRQMLRRVSY